MLHKTNIHVANQVGCVKINLTHDVQVKDPLNKIINDHVVGLCDYFRIYIFEKTY